MAYSATQEHILDNNRKWVYLFEEGNKSMKALLGGKGANIAEMRSAGLPVPPGFTITTDACNEYYHNERQTLPGLREQTLDALHYVETLTGKSFGDKSNPLLVSVRSGSPLSMPGMMDTVLNLGLNDETVEGLATLTQNRWFALDAYRRFIAMFAHIVLGVDGDKFHRVLERHKAQTEGKKDTDLSVVQLEDIIDSFKRIVYASLNEQDFPQDPQEQLRKAISAVIESWMGKRAVDYRRIHRIPDTLGTAANVQAMVFGNMGWDSGTGVCFTRNPSTGERKLYGEYLLNAQGEDVVAGIRTPHPITKLQEELPGVYQEFLEITQKLELHYHEMQDIEFTIERGKLWMLQTRDGKRSGAAAVRIAVEMVSEGLIDKRTAVQRVKAEQLDQLLHPMVDPEATVTTLTTGLPASPGAASGQISFDPDEAEHLAAEGHNIILVRDETNPDDFHGMVAAQAILTARGGMTSHAAVVARGMGKPCVVGAGALEIQYQQQICSIHGSQTYLRKGDWITVDGSTGRVLLGETPTIQPQLDENFHTLMSWADTDRTMGVRANADTPHDARVARSLGAEGIGLCRTEHMFFGDERLPIVREMILAESRAERERALEKLLPFQEQDFFEIFREMDGLPVTIRLLDPPLHEFLPPMEELLHILTDLKFAIQRAKSSDEMDAVLRQIWEKEKLLRQVQRLREVNPMLGHRGCRLSVAYPEIAGMQARAVFHAACRAKSSGVDVHPEIMIPLVSTAEELRSQLSLVKTTAATVFGEEGMSVAYLLGTMIELPRAALVADTIAEYADFFSFGTNDLTQTTFGLSRDDSARFLPIYIREKIYPEDPFQVLDRQGVGQLIQMAVTKGRAVKPGLKVGICGEHGGEPSSVEFCCGIGMNYVSCSPYRVPIARLAAAQAALAADLQLYNE